MKKLKKKILKPSTLDAIKAMRRGGREAEMELLGPVCLRRRCSRSEIKKLFLISLAYQHHSIHKIGFISRIRFILGRRNIKEVGKVEKEPMPIEVFKERKKVINELSKREDNV